MNTNYCTYYQSPIGLLMIAGTDEYVSEVLFINEGNEHLPAQRTNDLLDQCTAELQEYFSGQRDVFSIPFYQAGTVFQTKVWTELLNINFGKTISYLTLAKRLGDPKCIRAAASTNGKNSLCIVVPCHRVVGSDQSLVGYSGGIWRKRWLLEHENKIANGLQTLF